MSDLLAPEALPGATAAAERIAGAVAAGRKNRPLRGLRRRRRHRRGDPFPGLTLVGGRSSLHPPPHRGRLRAERLGPRAHRRGRGGLVVTVDCGVRPSARRVARPQGALSSSPTTTPRRRAARCHRDRPSALGLGLPQPAPLRGRRGVETRLADLPPRLRAAGHRTAEGVPAERPCLAARGRSPTWCR